MSFLNPKRWYHSLGKRRFYEALLLFFFPVFLWTVTLHFYAGIRK